MAARLLMFVVACLTVRFVPSRICRRDATKYYAGDERKVEMLLHGTGKQVERMAQSMQFRTGSKRFDGEWAMGTNLMTAIGAAQTAMQHPGSRDDALVILRLAMDRLADPNTRAYDGEAWNQDALRSLGEDERDHGAFLMYYAFALGMDRLADPEHADAQLFDQVIETLLRRAKKRPVLLLDSYPGETYPVDNAVFIGALGLHAKATGASHEPFFEKWEALARSQWIEQRTGLLYQAVDGVNGAKRDVARGSGTAAAAYYLSFARPNLSRDLWNALRTNLYREVLGFGLVREFVGGGKGDVDSGPVIFGLGVSATGFALGAARAHGDEHVFSSLYASAHLVGLPVDGTGSRNFVSGGPIGDAILFAMLTAPKIDASQVGAPAGAGAPVPAPATREGKQRP
ncbi:MAG: hypothetical protein U0174_03695 [Polyangiaceae bacterium]